MAINFECTACGQPIQVPDAMAGRRGLCPQCKTPVMIPGEKSAPAPGAAATPAADAPAAPRKMRPSSGAVARAAPDGGGDDGGEGGGDEQATKACPYCGEEVLKQAKKCKHCGEYLSAALRRQRESAATSAPGDEEMSGGDWVVAILCSTIGCIAGIVWMCQGKPKGKKMFGISLLFNLVWGAIRVMVEAGSHHR